MSSNTLVYTTQSSLIVVLNLPLSSLENSLAFSNMTYDSPQHTTLRPMDKLNKPIKNLKHIFRSFAPIICPHDPNSSLPLSSTTTLPFIAPPRNLHSLSFMVMNLDPILPLARPSSPHLKIVSQSLTKLIRKLLLLMNPPERSWPLGPLTDLPLGK